jgi:inner membrane transporter RhtA
MQRAAQAPPAAKDLASRLPPQAFFLVSAVFHYLGPALAVLLFARVGVLGVAWLRIASAAVIFAAWRRPWRWLASARADRTAIAQTGALGLVVAVMNSVFYLAIARLPLATVGAIEFLGTVMLAAAGTRTGRNALALALTTGGVAVISAIRLGGHPLGFVLAFANCALFMAYIVLGHAIATRRPHAVSPRTGSPRTGSPRTGSPRTGSPRTGSPRAGEPRAGSPEAIDLLAAAILIAAVAATPAGLGPAGAAFGRPVLLLAGIGVGICSTVIPYVTDQLAMARLPRATFAVMLALLPVFATIIGMIVLGQVPTLRDIAGITLVTAGVAVHKAGPQDAADKTAAEKTAASRTRERSQLWNTSASARPG